MSEPALMEAHVTVDDMPWQLVLPPTDLPYSDGEPMESPWHVDSLSMLKASYFAARGGKHDDYFVGTNMFVYYSMQQVKNQDYKGPDFFLVKDVDGTRDRVSWIVWEEHGRYPDVIIELLSPSTERIDLTRKKVLYERTFRTSEYFCVSPDVERLLGWRLMGQHGYEPIVPDERGWLWSVEMNLWVGAWHGPFIVQERTWLRFYTPDGNLVLMPDEAAIKQRDEERQRADEERQRADEERQRADEERQRADDLLAKVAALEAELARLRGES